MASAAGLQQLSLPLDNAGSVADRTLEDSRYLTDQLITYIGNKRNLLGPIENVVERAQERIGRPLRALDVFSGSGAVSRMLKSHSSLLIANDLEPYAEVLNTCFLANRDQVRWADLKELVDDFNAVVDASESTGGFIERLYAPRDDENIQLGERCFYTRDNARRLDHYRQLIGTADEELQPFLLAPLLSAASVNANTAGVFKGFYKDKRTGIGRFGGASEDALTRIKGCIRLRLPILSRHRCEVEIHQMDANLLPAEIGEVDLAYLDPPYNQHPYGSNYFMLNLLVDYVEPTDVSAVSGIPVDWQRSGYNVKAKSSVLMRKLVEDLDSRFLLISFNDEGFIEPDEMLTILQSVGEVNEFKTTYNTFRGSRNLQNRSTHVTEHLYLVEKDG